jgi:hypothetical protein
MNASKSDHDGFVRLAVSTSIAGAACAISTLLKRRTRQE